MFVCHRTFSANALRLGSRALSSRAAGESTRTLAAVSVRKNLQKGNLSQTREFHAFVAPQKTLPIVSGRFYSDGGSIASVPEVIEHIKTKTNADIVKKVNATYMFDVGSDGKYFIDLKNGNGNVKTAESGDKAEVTLTMTGQNMIKMFNRDKLLHLECLPPTGELKPATAFMSGKLKLSGDMGKALKLESLMKYSTWTQKRTYATPGVSMPLYGSVDEVFDRLKSVASEDVVKKVQAVFMFDVTDQDKFYLDFKNGSGAVEKGDPPAKADVTITMNKVNFLKIFNREMSPATGFMTGQIKVKGDLSKALTLEKVMVAAREAAEAERAKADK